MNLEYLINAETIPADGVKNECAISELACILLKVKSKPIVIEEIEQIYNNSNKWHKISRAALIPAYLSWFGPLLIREFDAGTVAFFTSVFVTYFISHFYLVNRHRTEIYRQILNTLNTNNAIGS